MLNSEARMADINPELSIEKALMAAISKNSLEG